jgi:hypothetical protein
MSIDQLIVLGSSIEGVVQIERCEKGAIDEAPWAAPQIHLT